jgi:O-antigen/teichoic acid export membrane protein
MSAWLLLQYVVIALAVLLSVWVVAKKQFPGSVRKLRVTIALPLLREGKPAWLRSLGLWISPVDKAAASACGGCDNCGPTKP